MPFFYNNILLAKKTTNISVHQQVRQLFDTLHTLKFWSKMLIKNYSTKHDIYISHSKMWTMEMLSVKQRDDAELESVTNEHKTQNLGETAPSVSRETDCSRFWLANFHWLLVSFARETIACKWHHSIANSSQSDAAMAQVVRVVIPGRVIPAVRIDQAFLKGK